MQNRYNTYNTTAIKDNGTTVSHKAFWLYCGPCKVSTMSSAQGERMSCTRLLGVRLCPPAKRKIHSSPNPTISECGLIWRQGFYRGN